MRLPKIIAAFLAASLVVLTIVSPYKFEIFWIIAGCTAFFISPVILGVYIAKKKNFQKIGKVFSLFCFILILVISGSLIVLQYFISSASVSSEKKDDEFKEYEKPFVEYIKAYNARKTPGQLDINAFSGLFERENNHGYIILQLHKDGEVRLTPAFFERQKENENMMAKRPEEIKYIILVEDQSSEYYGRYTDGAKAYRNVVKIKVYGLDPNSLLDSAEVYGNIPAEEKSYDRIKRTGGDVSGFKVEDKVIALIEKLN